MEADKETDSDGDGEGVPAVQPSSHPAIQPDRQGQVEVVLPAKEETHGDQTSC